MITYICDCFWDHSDYFCRFKDGDQLQEDDRHSFYADDEGFFAMTIDPVKVDDTGRYTCVASNEYGQATTSAFFRVVKGKAERQVFSS